MIRDYSRYPNYLPRQKLRALGTGESLIIPQMPVGAVRSARVACYAVGRERKCYYRMVTKRVDDAHCEVMITRLSLSEAYKSGLLRGKRRADAEVWAERQKNYLKFFEPVRETYRRRDDYEPGYNLP